MKPCKIPVSAEGYDAAFRLADLAEEVFRDGGLTGAQAMEAIAIFAGVAAFMNARPGHSTDVVALLQMTIETVHNGCCRGAGLPAGPTVGRA
ncbi:hypothetical protein [Azospirillum sp. A39]|uniref:hypothetical protein n=1 Tax=Azospirillum sp. A39 TaxID=3462279 RepID=UPI004045C371